MLPIEKIKINLSNYAVQTTFNTKYKFSNVVLC